MDKKKVLIVDDEMLIRQLLTSALDGDYTVLVASDGEEAINITRQLKPDLILMDILMPKVDGFTALSEIKRDEATRAIPVIMITGIGHELNKKLSEQFGADGYITKPFDLQELRDKVKQYELATRLTAS